MADTLSNSLASLSATAMKIADDRLQLLGALKQIREIATQNLPHGRELVTARFGRIVDVVDSTIAAVR